MNGDKKENVEKTFRLSEYTTRYHQCAWWMHHY